MDVHSGSGRTAFHAACASDHAACAEALVRAGADVEAQDSLGVTGQQVAERNGCAAVLAALAALAAERQSGQLAAAVRTAHGHSSRAQILPAASSGC